MQSSFVMRFQSKQRAAAAKLFFGFGKRAWSITNAAQKVTVATVGTLTEKRWGSPKEQSIRDQPERLKRLVELVSLAQKFNSSSPKRRGHEYESDLSKFLDQGAKARLRHALQELDQARSEIKMLKKAFRKLAPIDQIIHEPPKLGRCSDPAAEVAKIDAVAN